METSSASAFVLPAASGAGLRASSSASSGSFVEVGFPNAFDGAVSNADARFTLDDVIVTGPGNSPISVSFNLTLDGTLDHITANSQLPIHASQLTAIDYVVVSGTIAGNPFNGQHFEKQQIGQPFLPPLQVVSTGILSNYGGSTAFASPTILLLPNTPFTLSLDLSTQAFAHIDGGTGSNSDPDGYSQLARALTDFSHTLTFNTNGPAFNLPEGYTADSVEGGISNNIFSIPDAASLSGDYDGNGVVEGADFLVWQQGFGSMVAALSGADGNGNGVVDAADYTVWRDNLGSRAASANAAVPEPATRLLLLTGILTMCFCRRPKVS